MTLSDRRDLALVRGRQRARHRMGVGVLQRDESGQRLVDVVRIAECGVDLGGIKRPVRAVIERPRARADDDGMAGGLVDHEVVLATRDDLLAARQVGHHRHEVAHRAGRHEQAGVLAEQVCGPLLEGDDGGVVAEDIVADLGRRHRPPHGVGGSRNGVAPKVDHAVRHGPRV